MTATNQYSEEDVYKKLVGIIIKELDVKPDEIQPNVSFVDDYEGDFATRRALIYTLNFTAKTYLFGKIADNATGLIKKVEVDYYTNTDPTTAKREMRYTVTPKAVEDKNNDGVINTVDDALLGPGDDFGFSEGLEFFQDGK